VRKRKRWAWALAAAALLLAGPVLARVGGGESYGGGGSGGGGGSSGGGEAILELIYWMLYLTVQAPVIGVPLDLVVIGGAIYVYSRSKNSNRSSASAHALEQAAQRGVAISAAVEKLRTSDPYFSVHPFLDFVGLLYTRFQEARGRGRFEALSAFVSPELLQRFAPGSAGVGSKTVAVEAVVVGAVRIQAIRDLDGGEAAIDVELEANFAEVGEGSGGARSRQDLYAHERWTFAKAKDTPSKPPETIASLSCPSCGASGELSPEGRCGHCGQVVNTGRFHWVVRSMQTLEKRPKQAMEVTRGGGQEVGTGLPTIFAPDVQAQRHALEAEDPDFSWAALEAEVRRCFLELQKAWTEMKWERARAFETDHLFETHRFWIERYRESSLNNRVEDVAIDRVSLVKIGKDAFFEAITVRIFAKALDYTVDRAGKVVAGSKDRKREFSEYWTFIRRLPAARRPVAAPKEPGRGFSCPSCGAPIELTQTAICEYCGAKVASGEFGWVVSLIEQDEAYGG
jgi:predicted lipid-binding transport protein (Tim44 family)